MRGRRRALALAPSAALLAGMLAVAPAQATFPGDNGKVVWASTTLPTTPGELPTGDIWIASSDGTGAENLTATPNDEDNYPAISPDGSTVVFSSDRNGRGDLDLFMMDLGSHAVTPLPSSGNSEGWSAFSPAGDELAFAELTSAGWVVKVLDLDSGNKRTIGDGWHPNWSPDGSKIAFIRPVNSANDIMVAPASGGSATNLTQSAGVYEFAPDWAPNGSTIIYSSDEGSDFANVNLWTMSASGTNKTRVTNLSGWESEPGFSPDGSKIVFTRLEDPTSGDYGKQALYTAAVDGSGMTLLKDTALIEDHPQWQALGAEKVDTQVNVTAKNVKSKTKVSGAVAPEVAGAPVVVTYYKKQGSTYKPLQTKDVVADSSGKFKTAFKRKKPGKCLVTADYYGDAQHHASSAEKKFKC